MAGDPSLEVALRCLDVVSRRKVCTSHLHLQCDSLKCNLPPSYHVMGKHIHQDFATQHPQAWIKITKLLEEHGYKVEPIGCATIPMRPRHIPTALEKYMPRTEVLSYRITHNGSYQEKEDGKEQGDKRK